MNIDQPVRILLVDDRSENLLTLESILSELGHELVQARSGVEALRYLLKQEVALILLDVQMPEMDGFETAKLIRARERSQHTPIIFLTALDRSDMNVFQGYSVGAVDVMFKPFLPEVLRYKVAVFVDLYKKSLQIHNHAEQLEQRVEQRTLELTNLNAMLRTEIQERERVEESLRFMITMSTTLASSLELDAVLRHICELSVPRLASACIVDLFDTNIATHQVSLRHTNTRSEEALLALIEQYDIETLLTPQQVYTFDIHEPIHITAMQPSSGLSPLALQALDAVDIRAVLTIPLMVEQKSVGVVYLLFDNYDQHYSDTQLVMAAELGLRGAMALEHSWLYHSIKQALKVRDQFLSVASHELKTPITTVLGYAQLLERRLKRETEQNPRNLKALTTLVEQCQRLDRLIRSLLDLSRIQMGQFTLEQVRFDIVSFIRGIVEETQPLVQNHELNFYSKAVQTELFIHGDELRLAQVFQNLIQNAVKYSPTGGRVDVVVQAAEQGVVVEVRDQGMGIPADSIPQLFDRFYRASNINADVSGMGLGLFVVREIVSLHHGSISVESVENEGSTFRIFLPYAAASSNL